eukprot:scaffold2262_cov262-Pinguiococcus_pyrenoidosus.AAC.10
MTCRCNCSESRAVRLPSARRGRSLTEPEAHGRAELMSLPRRRRNIFVFITVVVVVTSVLGVQVSLERLR